VLCCVVLCCVVLCCVVLCCVVLCCVLCCVVLCVVLCCVWNRLMHKSIASGLRFPTDAEIATRFVYNNNHSTDAGEGFFTIFLLGPLYKIRHIGHLCFIWSS